MTIRGFLVRDSCSNSYVIICLKINDETIRLRLKIQSLPPENVNTTLHQAHQEVPYEYTGLAFLCTFCIRVFANYRSKNADLRTEKLRSLNFITTYFNLGLVL